MISHVEHDEAACRDIHVPGDWSIVPLPVGEHDKPRDDTISLKERVKLHGSLGLSEPCPGEHRETELEECRIEDVELFAQLQLVLGGKR